MGKVLTYLLLLFLNQQIIAATTPDNLSDMPNWQLRGMARSALRMNDNHQAARFLVELHKRDQSDNKIAMQLGNIYMETRQYKKAIEIFRTIYESDPRRNLEAQFYYAFLLKMHQEYEEALEHFDLLRMRARRISGNQITRNRVENLIEGSHLAIAHRDTLVNVKVSHLDSSINSKYSQTGAILLNINEFVYGSTKNEIQEIVDLSKPYKPVMQFYKAVNENGKWQGQKEPDAPFFNLPNHDTGRGAFSPDGQRFYFSGCETRFDGKTICHLFVSILMDETWSQPEKLSSSVNHPEFTSTQPTVGNSFDTNLEVLYFISDRPEGAGGMDIWFSVYDKRSNQYQEAQNAGVFINTPQDEITPFYDVTNRRLYFSSNGLPGYGGFDIYYAQGGLVTWQTPVNLGRPINSSWDDTSFSKNESNRAGFFTSNRHIANLDERDAFTLDIYSFQIVDEYFKISYIEQSNSDKTKENNKEHLPIFDSGKPPLSLSESQLLTFIKNPNIETHKLKQTKGFTKLNQTEDRIIVDYLIYKDILEEITPKAD